MRPGDPFATKEIDKQRARQRRALRLIEEWIVEQVAAGSALDLSGHSEPGLLETELRALADKELEAIDADLLGRMARAETADVVLPLLSDYDGLTWSRHPNEFRPELQPLRDTYYQQTKNRVGELPERSDELIRAVVLLIWADALADDGYVDPRVRRTEERWRARS